MTVVRILTVPNRLLKRKAVKVPNWQMKGKATSVKQLADDMVETLRANWGVGLAANQVGEMQKVAIIWPADQETPLVLVNPKILEASGERVVEEGCLSTPGYRFDVKRWAYVKVRGRDINGKILTLKVSANLLSQVLQHEIDHLNGVLCIDRQAGGNKRRQR